ncbi:hypothetical protein D9C73_000864 [Collichthys lucidus]|uniref:Uncharacterized protein n=1 Tax=Collichthys lucidus TaxID=240159 RepID=A0A4V6APZ9_COLLU|nr:hypothetical protein D9C73_000864 [Collichthys lucidus]
MAKYPDVCQPLFVPGLEMTTPPSSSSSSSSFSAAVFLSIEIEVCLLCLSSSMLTRKSVEQSESVQGQCDFEDEFPYEWFRERPDKEIMRFTTVCEVPRKNIHREILSANDKGRNLSEQHPPAHVPVGKEPLPADVSRCGDHLPDNLSGDLCSSVAEDLPEVLPTASSHSEPEKETQTKEPSSEYLPTNVSGSAGDVPTEGREGEINDGSRDSSDTV